jgi:hypothetical protein
VLLLLCDDIYNVNKWFFKAQTSSNALKFEKSFVRTTKCQSKLYFLSIFTCDDIKLLITVLRYLHQKFIALW